MDSAGDHNPDTSMHPSSGSSPTDTSPTTARDGDIEALTITRTQRAYHSFIIHTNNIMGEWKNITRHARPGPTFVVFDHIDSTPHSQAEGIQQEHDKESAHSLVVLMQEVQKHLLRASKLKISNVSFSIASAMASKECVSLEIVAEKI
jgi:hypothetical protein